MGTLIVDSAVIKDIDFVIDEENQTIKVFGAARHFKHEKKFLADLAHALDTGIYPHLIVNYHNTYHFYNGVFQYHLAGCLPLKIYTEDKKTVLELFYNKDEKVSQEYLDKYTELFKSNLPKREVKNAKRSK